MFEQEFLKGKTAVVTGASRSIGKQIALSLAERGADVVVNYRQDHNSAKKVVREIQGMGARSHAIAADVSLAEEAWRLIREANEFLGRIDILINNVGPFVMSSLTDTTLELWREMIDGNLSSAFFCTQAVVPVMRGQGGGHVVFLGANKADSTRARPNGAAYGIAKTGVVILAKTLAREEGRYGIRANVVSPGVILTGNPSDKSMKQYAGQTAMNRLGTLRNISDAVLFLLSPQGEYLTGGVIPVDGGLWL